MTSASVCSWTRVANTVSKSRSVLACRTCSCSPRVRAAACRSRTNGSPIVGLVGLTGQQFAQQLQPLRRYLDVQVGHARQVAAGSVQAGDEAEFNRIGGCGEDRGDRRGRRLGPQGWWSQRALPPGDESAPPPAPAVARIGPPPSGIDCYVATLDVTSLIQAPGNHDRP
jgi:hypothetical protein